MDKNSLIILFLTVCIPLALLVFLRLPTWLFRRVIDRSMINGSDGFTSINPPLERAAPPLVPLVIRRLEASEVGPATGRAAAALADAEVTTRSARSASVVAGLGYIAITTIALTLGMSALVFKWPAYAKFFLVYLQQWPALFLLVWFAGISLPRQLAMLGGYLLLGLLLVPIAPSFSAAVYVVSQISPPVFLGPLTGLLLLLARPFRPWLIGVLAILLFLLTGLAAGFLFGLDNLDMTRANPWWFIVGAIYPVVAAVFVGWLLSRHLWRNALAGLALLATAGLLLIWLCPKYKIGPFSLGPLLIGLPANVVQVFIVWSFFKLLLWLHERHFVPTQVLHSHLCWGFLAAFNWVFAAYVYHGWAPWAVLLAYALYFMILHALFRKLRATRVDRPGKRLLLLRVFGRADKREKLLDALDDTWRRLGRIDLIAGADLATRTMGSLMLEAFLLRRTDEQFLKTAEEVDRRLEHLHSRLEGDARYPINSVYCYATAWQHAVAYMAPKADAVLMDLRGFTKKNQGCVFELTWVVQQIQLSRIILLIDATSDYQALEEIAQAAWTNLRSDSPNAGYLEPVLTILNTPLQSKDSRRALFMLLLRATYHVDSIDSLPEKRASCGFARF